MIQHRGAKFDRAGTPICVGDFVRVARCLYSVIAHQEYRADFRRCAGRILPVVGWDSTGLAWIPNGNRGVLSVEFSGRLDSGVAEFRGIRAYLRLSVSPKHAHSRLMGTYWLASMFIPVALAASALTSIIALWAWFR